MSKHILDRSRTERESTLKRTRDVLLQDQPHRATVALQQRKRLRDDQHRQAHFLRIARVEADQPR